jgi:hypothetical protein
MRTRVGNLIKVENPRQLAKNHEYRGVILKENGISLPYIFTDTELEVAYARYNKFMDTIIKQSLISKIID